MSATSSAAQNISAREWAWVERLIRDVQEQERRDQFLATFFQWELAERQFVRMEWDVLGEDSHTEEDLRHHASCLRSLIDIGQHLCRELPRHDPDALKAQGVTLEVIDAILWGLQQSWEAWHVPKDPALLAELKQRIFNVPA